MRYSHPKKKKSLGSLFDPQLSMQCLSTCNKELLLSEWFIFSTSAWTCDVILGWLHYTLLCLHQSFACSTIGQSYFWHWILRYKFLLLPHIRIITVRTGTKLNKGAYISFTNLEQLTQGGEISVLLEVSYWKAQEQAYLDRQEI